jgi:hypothetical protein
LNLYTASANGAVLTVRFAAVKSGWEQWLLLSGDRHHDNVHCDRRLEHYHLEQARDREALIIDVGDLFCAMQGKYDPRSNMDDLRPEDKSEKYLDKIVEHAADFYAPFADNWLLMGKGNHESNISRRHGTDLTSNLVHRLNSDHDGRVFIGGFGGWVRFIFQDDKNHGRGTVNMKYFHGAGGEAPVTRGVIQTNRQAVYLPDANVVVNGHNHHSYHLPIKRERLTTKGVVTQDIVHYVRTPGYKDEYADGSGGWHVERGGVPKPIGCVWMRITMDRKGAKNNDMYPHLEFIQDVT